MEKLASQLNQLHEILETATDDSWIKDVQQILNDVCKDALQNIGIPYPKHKQIVFIDSSIDTKGGHWGTNNTIYISDKLNAANMIFTTLHETCHVAQNILFRLYKNQPEPDKIDELKSTLYKIKFMFLTNDNIIFTDKMARNLKEFIENNIFLSENMWQKTKFDLDLYVSGKSKAKQKIYNNNFTELMANQFAANQLCKMNQNDFLYNKNKGAIDEILDQYKNSKLINIFLKGETLNKQLLTFSNLFLLLLKPYIIPRVLKQYFLNKKIFSSKNEEYQSVQNVYDECNNSMIQAQKYAKNLAELEQMETIGNICTELQIPEINRDDMVHDPILKPFINEISPNEENFVQILRNAKNYGRKIYFNTQNNKFYIDALNLIEQHGNGLEFKESQTQEPEILQTSEPTNDVPQNKGDNPGDDER